MMQWKETHKQIWFKAPETLCTKEPASILISPQFITEAFQIQTATAA